MRGQGSEDGSVSGGGVLYELQETVPGKPPMRQDGQPMPQGHPPVPQDHPPTPHDGQPYSQ